MLPIRMKHNTLYSLQYNVIYHWIEEWIVIHENQVLIKQNLLKIYKMSKMLAAGFSHHLCVWNRLIRFYSSLTLLHARLSRHCGILMNLSSWSDQRDELLMVMSSTDHGFSYVFLLVPFNFVVAVGCCV